MRRVGLTIGVVMGIFTITGSPAGATAQRPNPNLTTATATVAAPTAASMTRHPVLIRPATADASMTVTVAFVPRDAALLRRLAASRTGMPGIPLARLRALFAAPATETTSTTNYLESHGLRPLSGGILTRTYSGTVADVEAAFQTPIGVFHADGSSFRAPARTPMMPASLASGITAISGLDSYRHLQPAVTGSAATLSPATAVTAGSGCPDPDIIEQFLGGYQPADLASPNGYDFQSLLDANHAGSGDSLAVVEFSSYDPADVAAYQTCYGTTVPITDVPVAGGTTALSGAGEVDLDEEVAAATAPGLDHIYSYVADPSTSSFAGVIDQIVADLPTTHTSEVSISWGECESTTDAADVAASDYSFQLAAAAGLSVYAATGDSGSAGCPPSTSSQVWYPASDPYVTAVGGTTLDVATGDESSWGSPATASGGGGGGGVSSLFPMPSWQTGSGVIESGYSSKTACGQNTRYCRELPDAALDANPDTGYIIYCAAVICQNAGWTFAGGTSAATPLLAAMTADANSFSLANGGGRLGFASPFLYTHPGDFRDITDGSNNAAAGDNYPAGTGFDMATGLGSPRGAQLATSLSGSTAAPTSFDTTTLTGASVQGSISANAPATLHGTLRDTTSGLPLGDETIFVSGTYALAGTTHTVMRHALTSPSGSWSVSLTTSTVKARMVWHAAFVGDQGLNPSFTGWNTLRVMPVLTTTSTARWTGSSYTVVHGRGLTLKGAAAPIMAGAKLTVQYKPYGGSAWHSTNVHATIGAAGRYSVGIVTTGAGKEYLRFTYAGSTAGQWLSASSPAKLLVIT